MTEAIYSAGSAESSEVIDPFEHFAMLDFYQRENSDFVESIGLENGQVVVEPGPGPGNISKLISKIIGEDGELFAVDFSRVALLEAQRKLAGIDTTVHLIQGRAEDLSNILGSLKGKIDAVVSGNAVHNFSNKLDFFKGVKELLKKGRKFAFNTTFFEGALSDDALKFNKAWVFKAMRIVSSDLKLSERGSFSSQKPGKESKVQASPENWLTPEQYEALLVKVGFKNIEMLQNEWEMPLEAFTAIAQDPEFLRGSLPSIPPEVATRALQKAAEILFAERGLTFSSRTWIRVMATA